MILDRDMKKAGIPKRDERGRTIDVHAMRTTFGTMLSTTGTAPRTAQAAMRHSDIKLTMGVYTDPKLLDVRQAVERLPQLGARPEPVARPSDGPGVGTGLESAHDCARTGDPQGQFLASADKMGRISDRHSDGGRIDVSACPVNEKAPVTSAVTGAFESGRRDLNPRPLAPQNSGRQATRRNWRQIQRL